MSVSIYNLGLAKALPVINDPHTDLVDPPDDLDALRVPFIFVPHGDPLPMEWMAEHPDYFTVPAVMIPRTPDGSRRPWAEIQALLRGDAEAWRQEALRGAPEPLPSPPAEPMPAPPANAIGAPSRGLAVSADPVGAYLRMAKVFAHPAASAGVVPATSKPSLRQYADAAQAGGSRTDAAPAAESPAQLLEPPAQRVNAAAGAADDASHVPNGAGGLPHPSHVNNIGTVISQTIAGSDGSSYFRYYQNNGQLYIVNGTTGDSAYIATGYSGAPGHVNDSLAEIAKTSAR